jgi:hypothetical protein
MSDTHTDLRGVLVRWHTDLITEFSKSDFKTITERMSLHSPVISSVWESFNLKDLHEKWKEYDSTTNLSFTEEGAVESKQPND